MNSIGPNSDQLILEGLTSTWLWEKVKNPCPEDQAFACPDQSGGIHCTLDRLFVIPTEVEGSHGTTPESRRRWPCPKLFKHLPSLFL